MFFQLVHFPGPGPIVLGDLTGRCEIAVTGSGAAEAIVIVNALLGEHPAAVLGPGNAARLSVSDRDRIMAQLQIAHYGSRIAGDSTCRKCEAKFDFDFDLHDLMAALAPPEPVMTDAAGWIEDGQGTRFRLPTGEDELAAVGLNPEAASNVIALRCLPEGTSPDQVPVIEEKAQKLAPLMDLTLDATCPECGTANPMAFAAERYFLSSIKAERRRLLREIHQIAMNYGWSYDAIVDLTRAHRRELVAQIDRDREAAHRSRVR